MICQFKLLIYKYSCTSKFYHNHHVILYPCVLISIFFFHQTNMAKHILCHLQLRSSDYWFQYNIKNFSIQIWFMNSSLILLAMLNQTMTKPITHVVLATPHQNHDNALNSGLIFTADQQSNDNVIICSCLNHEP